MEPGFAALPATVERLLTGAPGGLPEAMAPVARAERVAVVLLDAFGMHFVERHADHPLLRRAQVSPLATQFPSTTTAHVTTMHTGLPVGEHGLYEWNVLEPGLGAIVTPIIYSWGNRLEPDSLRGSGVTMAELLPRGTFYERLAEAGARSTVHQPDAFSPSTYDTVVARGAQLRPFGSLAEGLRGLAASLREPGYAYLYWHVIDATGHEQGPDSPAFDAACREALDALEAALPGLPVGTLLLMTADHGQVAVDPARVDYLDELLPTLDGYLRPGRDGRPLGPAGSARDVFLHAAPGLAGDLAHALRERLGERAEVMLTAELEAQGRFGEVGPRLRERLADVCVLPAPGREAWVRAYAGVERRFRGHHGGLHPAECSTWLGAILCG